MIERRDMFEPLLDACPSFRPTWDAFVTEWSDEGELPQYLALTELARHLVGMLEAGDTAGLRQVFQVVEAWHLDGDPYVREAAKIGLLEDLQNGHLHEGSTCADDFVPFLLPETKFWWSKVNDFWERGAPIVDDRTTDGGRSNAPRSG